MSEVVQTAIEKTEWYVGVGWHHVVFLLALVYLIFSRREKENRLLFVGYSFIFFVIYFFPFTAMFIMYYCTGDLVYWRMFWLLPIPMVLAYTCTKLYGRFKKGWIRGICIVILAAAIGLTGRNLYLPEVTPYQKATNIYKLPQEVVDVCDLINADWNSTEEVRVIAPEAIGGYIRQYDANVQLLYGRRGDMINKVKRIYEGMESGNPPIKRIVRYARKHRYLYFVYETNEQQDAKLKELGFEPIGQCDAYIIYKDGNPA